MNLRSVFLQVLWAEDRAEKDLTAKQSFVDIGCGNGLLVHILTNEGVTVMHSLLLNHPKLDLIFISEQSKSLNLIQAFLKLKF